MIDQKKLHKDYMQEVSRISDLEEMEFKTSFAPKEIIEILCALLEGGNILGKQIQAGDYGQTPSNILELKKDKERLDWLADINNKVGNVLLPRECVLLTSLRDSIDETMETYPIEDEN